MVPCVRSRVNVLISALNEGKHPAPGDLDDASAGATDCVRELALGLCAALGPRKRELDFAPVRLSLEARAVSKIL